MQLKIKIFHLAALSVLLQAHAGAALGYSIDVLNLPKGQNAVTTLAYDDKSQDLYAGVAEDSFPYSLNKASSRILKIHTKTFRITGNLSLAAGENPLVSA